MLRNIAFAIVVAVTTSGCGTVSPVFYPIGFAVPAQIDPHTEIRSTASDKTLYRQFIRLGRYARLAAPVKTETNSSFRLVRHDVSTSELLFPGTALSEAESAVVYCTVNTTAVAAGMSVENAKRRTCFFDKDGAGKFQFFAEGIRNYLEYPFEASPLFAKENLSEPVRLDPPVAYAPVMDVNTPRVEMAIRFEPGNKGPAKLSVVFMQGQIEKELEEASKDIPTDKPYPFVLDMRGAKVEIHSLKDGLLSYRMLSGFDERKIIMFDLPTDGMADQQ